MCQEVAILLFVEQIGLGDPFRHTWLDLCWFKVVLRLYKVYSTMCACRDMLRLLHLLDY